MPRNLFDIGREKDDEDQLTEMLAYLLEREPHLVPALLTAFNLDLPAVLEWTVETQVPVPGGFCDLVRTDSGVAEIVVESKIQSKAAPGQLCKYLNYLEGRGHAEHRALVFLTKMDEPVPDDVKAGRVGVPFKHPRWRDVASVLRTQPSALVDEFVSMLEREGIVTPDPITASDLSTFQAGMTVWRRLASLLDELGVHADSIWSGFQRAGAVSAQTSGYMIRPLDFEGIRVWVGFWPVRAVAAGETAVLLNVVVADVTRPPGERKQAASEAAHRCADRAFSTLTDRSEYSVVRSLPANQVLDNVSDGTQVERLVHHAQSTLLRLQEVGYLASRPTET